MLDQVAALARSLARPELALLPALLGAAVLCPAGWWLARALHGSRVLAAASGAALAGAVAITVARPGLGTGVRGGTANLTALATCTVSDPWVVSPEALLNVALLVPFALLAGLAIGRPVLVIVIAVLASAGIEAVQAMYSLGVCDSSDLVHNGVGAVDAALLGAAARYVWQRFVRQRFVRQRFAVGRSTVELPRPPLDPRRATRPAVRRTA
jgi:hypothetical protein